MQSKAKTASKIEVKDLTARKDVKGGGAGTPKPKKPKFPGITPISGMPGGDEKDGGSYQPIVRPPSGKGGAHGH